MRHRKAGVKLSRTSSHKDAMFRNMVTSLFKYDRIQTTDAKAKELRRWADKLITLAKRGDLHARRRALSIVREKDVVHKLFEAASERFGSVSGGYTRIVKIGHRPGDAAPVSLVELIAAETKDKKKKSAKKTKSAKKAPAAVEEKEAPPAASSGAGAEETPEKPEAPVATEAVPREEAAADAAEAQDDAAAAEKEAEKAAAETGDVGEKSGAEDAGETADKKEDK
jgi:large subunit ribosomal protein L17